jgi:hypothetical protein
VTDAVQDEKWKEAEEKEAQYAEALATGMIYKNAKGQYVIRKGDEENAKNLGITIDDNV